MADSLAAIKKLVFDERRVTPAELADALETDFAGEKGEQIRQMLVNDAPKYGNDDDSVDQLVVDAYQSYIDEIAKYPNTRHGRGPIGGIRYAGTSSISANVGQGMGTMATPDGRHAHELLAEGCSPAHNADTHGPTAVFKSVSKLPTEKITGGVLLNQKMAPTMLASERNKQKLEMLISAFFDRLHGYHVQYNIVSRETLLDAQVVARDAEGMVADGRRIVAELGAHTFPKVPSVSEGFKAIRMLAAEGIRTTATAIYTRCRPSSPPRQAPPMPRPTSTA